MKLWEEKGMGAWWEDYCNQEIENTDFKRAMQSCFCVFHSEKSSNKNSLQYFSFSGAATMYTRYKIVEKQNQTSYFSTPVFNLVSLVLGLVGCIGMGIVANFQV